MPFLWLGLLDFSVLTFHSMPGCSKKHYKIARPTVTDLGPSPGVLQSFGTIWPYKLGTYPVWFIRKPAQEGQ